MPTPIQLLVGPQTAGDGSTPVMRGGRQGDGIVSELHGRFYETNFRGNLYSGGTTTTAINAATFTTATLGATCTPILGIWNPLTNTVNAVLMQALLQIVITALQNTGGGPFVWATATGQSAITTGNQPLNRKTLLQSGSSVKDMSGLALTGLVGNLTVRSGSGVAGGNIHNIASLDTAAGYPTILQPSIQNVDGEWIIPPGGVLALLATTTPVAQSSAGALIWEEVPI